MSDTNPQGQGQVVQNPALGSLAPQIQLPGQQPQQFQQAPQQQQSWSQVPVQPQNPYVVQPQQANPYGAVQQQNPYGQQQPQQSPFAAPPMGQNQFLQPGQVPPGQAAPFQPQQPQQFQQPQQQQNPAFQFNPYSQPAPQQAQQQQVPGNPFAQLPAQAQPQQQQSAQLNAQQLAQQEGGITDAQVKEIFPDQTSQAIFQGMNAISKGQGIDLLAAFGSAYERRDPSLVNERYLAQFDPATTAMLKGQFEALVQQGQQRDAAAEQQVYQMAGGKENWSRAVQAFNQSADKQTIDAVAAAVNSGDPNQVHLAVQHILRAAQQGGNMIQRSGQLLTPNGGGQNAQQVMTNDAFRQHLSMLEQAHPVGSPQYNQHYQQLVKQRAAAKAQGY
ncbi:hypothetical protein [Pantoea phage LIMEzero]|uniref:Scaffolding protein n=1 Tax=Pantoea phage LIMEzero TaxID=943335 RepID=F4N9U2_9CAUD|nr:head scaffolding protein [Pantoea phage LIMEzero]CBY88570.1 hypothetical protein [Pantoea phage LIMEzero]